MLCNICVCFPVWLAGPGGSWLPLTGNQPRIQAARTSSRAFSNELWREAAEEPAPRKICSSKYCKILRLQGKKLQKWTCTSFNTSSGSQCTTLIRPTSGILCWGFLFTKNPFFQKSVFKKCTRSGPTRAMLASCSPAKAAQLNGEKESTSPTSLDFWFLTPHKSLSLSRCNLF